MQDNFYKIGLLTFLTLFSLRLSAYGQDANPPIHSDSTTVRATRDSTGSSHAHARASDILTGNTQEARVFTMRKYNFLQSSVSMVSSVTSDTSMNFELQYRHDLQFGLTPEQLHKIIPLGPDPMGEELRRRFSDTPSVVPISPLFAQALKSLFERSQAAEQKMVTGTLPIPTSLEIDVLKILWSNVSATSSDLYTQLDTSWTIRAEDFNRVLEDMVVKGYLDRRKISPSNKFTLFGLAQIEMSSLNRKNQLYLYWPVVSKKEIIRYLEAKRYLTLSSVPSSTDGVKNIYIESLDKKLHRLVE